MPQWDKVRSIAVIYPDGNIQHILNTLEDSGKEAVLLTMPDKKDVCWLTQLPKANVRESISARKYDLLIDLTQHSCLTMQYMAMYVQADFKVGRYMRDGVYDLTIDTPPQASPDFLYEQIVRYIKMFTQNA
jgi:hypothetical protein